MKSISESLSLKLGRLQIGNRNHISAIKDKSDELELEHKRKLRAQKRALKRDLEKSQVVADFIIAPPQNEELRMKTEDRYEDCGFNQGDTIEFKMPRTDKIKKGVVVGRSSTSDMAGQKPWFTVNIGRKKVKYLTVHKSQIIGTVE